ncbi:MAG: hypothetical protein H6906_16110, partial [Hyphomicrobiales bacterium]|nr:hypothetical protein [Hyphomicrobiales bacterium]
TLAAAPREAAVTATATATGVPDLSLGQRLPATLVGRTATGQPIFQVRDAAIAVNARTALPAGSTATLEVLSRPVPAPVPAAESVLRREAVLLRQVLLQRDWPDLREALQAVQAADPQAARHLVATALPQANRQLAANLLFFLSALGLGDLRGWLGEAPLRALHRARPDLAARLGEDFARLGRLADDAPPGDWRLTPVPFHNGRELEPLMLFARRQRDEDDGDDAGGRGTRFIIDVTLSRLGRLQLDGLLKDGKKHLDLIVRSETPLPPAVREGIRTIYREAAEITGLKGGVGFQAAPERMVDLPAAAALGAWAGMTV